LAFVKLSPIDHAIWFFTSDSEVLAFGAPGWRLDGVAINGACSIALLLLAAVFLEGCIRRQERRRA